MSKRVEEGSWPQIYQWYWGAAERWPEVFPQDAMRTQLVLADQLSDGDPVREVELLRASLLRLLYKATQDCQRCPLAGNRLLNTPVLDDGDPELDVFAEALGEKKVPIGALSARIMVVGEGPGEYEQRTGLPLVGFQELHGSRCLRACGQFERCYPKPLGQTKSERLANGEIKPAAPCKPTPLSKVVEKEAERFQPLYQLETVTVEAVQQARADRGFYELNTMGEILDMLLVKNVRWAWRNSWNLRSRILNIGGREATLYVTNAVKCRSMVNGENRTPPTESIDACRDYLQMQIYVVQPQAILILGNPALYALEGEKNSGILSRWGDLIWVADTPALIAPHPSWAVRQNSPQTLEEYKERLVEHFETLRKIVDGEVTLPAGVAVPSKPPQPEAVADPRDVPAEAQAYPESRDEPAAPAGDPADDFDLAALTPPPGRARRPGAQSAPRARLVIVEEADVLGKPAVDDTLKPTEMPPASTLPADWEGPTEPEETTNEEALTAAS